ncbi:MAG: SigB/SigF/SigG family RNA polymerase sigma factor [Tenericutes bacterium]|nr:SigB/SigF/SigG family RNA polymerase sigma factor [Mycoplasmatota bacterium]
MARHKVEISGVNTADIKVLSSEETEELFKRMKNNDPTARDELINGNLKLVLSIIKKFNHRNENLDDLFQVGCIGLCKAIDNFDLSHGVKLSTYAVPMILGEVKRYLRDNSSLRISRSIKDLAYNTLKAKEEMTKRLGREVTLEEIANELDVDYFDIITAQEAMKSPVSIFEPIYNDGGDTIYLYDQIEDKHSKEQNLDVNLAVNKAVEDLDKREKYIIEERYIIGKTQMEIANELGISQAQISRLEKNAINTLKQSLK